MKILTIIGARPQFIKAAAVSNIIRKKHNELIIHTGQHYDENMSKIFFDELLIPKPDYNLGIGSGGHGMQTGNMLIKLEEIYLKEKPDFVLVYGDTNSTLAGALCASKMLINVAHVEAGLRSFNMNMPEEQNRIITDHISNLLFAPTNTAKINLKNEGINNGVYNVGDVMYDAILNFKKMASKKEEFIYKNELRNKKYILVTIHRAENTNDINRMKNIIKAINESGENIIFPIHPRTRKYLSTYNLKFSDNVKVIEPVGYLEMICLELYSQKIMTDSGGVQKEAYFMKKPCITVRDETEWVETVQIGWNKLTGTDSGKILEAIQNFNPVKNQEEIFGNGNSAQQIVNIIDNWGC